MARDGIVSGHTYWVSTAVADRAPTAGRGWGPVRRDRGAPVRRRGRGPVRRERMALRADRAGVGRHGRRRLRDRLTSRPRPAQPRWSLSLDGLLGSTTSWSEPFYLDSAIAVVAEDVAAQSNPTVMWWRHRYCDAGSMNSFLDQIVSRRSCVRLFNRAMKSTAIVTRTLRFGYWSHIELLCAGCEVNILGVIDGSPGTLAHPSCR